MQSRWWDFGGDTIIRTDKYVRLASDKPSRDGWIFSRVPLTATNWEVRSQLHKANFDMLTRVD
jgi:mannose-binding lectin 2